jgi:hypothetical protein
MKSRKVKKDGKLIGHTTSKWEEIEGNFVEKLVLLTEVGDGISSASEKPHGVAPFNYASDTNEERTPLFTLGSPKLGSSKSPEEDLGDEITKLLERKDDEATSESLSGNSKDGGFELDFEDDDLGDKQNNR